MSPAGMTSQPEWKGTDGVLENHLIRQTPEASHHWIRLSGPEKPHIHKTHDLTVVVVEGEANVHFQKQTYRVVPGDVIFIPRGAVHWAQNRTPDGAVVYAVFTPPSDGKDYLQVD